MTAKRDDPGIQNLIKFHQICNNLTHGHIGQLRFCPCPVTDIFTVLSCLSMDGQYRFCPCVHHRTDTSLYNI